MAFIISDNRFSHDSRGVRATRLYFLSNSIDTYALELGIEATMLAWAQGAAAAFDAAQATQSAEIGEKLSAFQVSQAADAVLSERYQVLKDLVVSRYPAGSDIPSDYGIRSRTPRSNAEIVDAAENLVEGNNRHIAAADPNALPQTMIDAFQLLIDDAKEKYYQANLERREADAATDAIQNLFEEDSAKLRSLYNWVLAYWGKYEPKLIDLGFVPAQQHGGGYPDPPANLTFTDGTNTFSWDAVDGATSYQLVIKPTTENEWIDAYTGPNTSIAYNPGDGIFDCKVRARNANGFGDWSAPIQIQLPNTLTPPANVTVVHEVGSIRRNVISFDVPVGATLIDVYVSIVPLGDPEGVYNLDGTFDALSPIERPVGTGVRFWYYLIARNGTQSSLESTHVYVDAS